MSALPHPDGRHRCPWPKHDPIYVAYHDDEWGVVERDETERVASCAAARALGGRADGLRNPRPPRALAGRLQLGLY